MRTAHIFIFFQFMVNEKKNAEVELKKYLVMSTVYTKDKLGGQHV